MGCACKNKIALEERYGKRAEVGLIGKVMNFLLRVFVYLIVALIAVVMTPIVIVVVLFKMFFSSNKGITIPKKVIEILKRLEGDNG